MTRYGEGHRLNPLSPGVTESPEKAGELFPVEWKK